jgi:hypothetical protein
MVSVPRLDAEQRLAWPGRLPTDLASLPGLMERLHFGVIRRVTLGQVRPRASSVGVSCDLFGRFPVLVFERAGDEVAAGRAVRRYCLRPGPMTRRVPDGGTFELGLSDRGGETQAWVRVTGFPSLPLSCPPPVPTIYADFHAHVSYAYLRVLRARLAGQVLLHDPDEHLDADR